MIALVTGVTGFLGGRVCAALLDAGWQVRGVSRREPDRVLRSRAGLRWLERDLSSSALAPGDLEGVDTVLHLAGANGGAGLDERGYLDANERTLLNVLAPCQGRRLRVVHASSQVVYGATVGVAIPEEAPLSGDSPYSCSKVNSEAWLRWHQRRSGGVVVSLRLTGFVEGGGAVTGFVADALAGRPIEVLSNGSVRRDYLAAADGARAFILAAQRPLGPGFHAYNVGSGAPMTTLELARLVCAETGSRSEVVPSPSPAPRKDCALDVAKARRELGFDPLPLREAVRAFVRERVGALR
jgi:nucleoside-diphosphate-sugar epimerase